MESTEELSDAAARDGTWLAMEDIVFELPP